MTIKDIANILGYSPSTISKALNDSYEISRTTKKKILKAVNLYNYKPNLYAAALRKRQKSLILGVILPDLKDNFFLDSLNGITEESSKNNYKIMVYQSCNNYKKEVTYAKLLSESNIIDGLIYSPSKETLMSKNQDHLSNITNKGIPIVFIEKKNLVFFSNSAAKENGFKTGRNSVKKLLKELKKKSVKSNT